MSEREKHALYYHEDVYRLLSVDDSSNLLLIIKEVEGVPDAKEVS